MDGQRERVRAMRGDIAAHGINLLQLDPPVPMHTPDGAGLARILSECESDGSLLWTVEFACGAIRTYASDALAHAAAAPWASVRAA